jgi:hypothetical protein
VGLWENGFMKITWIVFEYLLPLSL